MEHASDKTLDCTGLNCSMPVIKTKQVMDTMEVGQVLKMVADNPGVDQDIQHWVRQMGHELLATEEKGGTFIFYIQKAK